MATEDKWMESTLKALIHSKNVTGIQKAQMLSTKEFIHPDVKCILIDKFNNMDEYNFFMIKRYNDYIETEFMINIHNDGFVINPEVWSDEFLDYDYIGALWTIVSPDTIHGVNQSNRVGNGGFSLRSKKFMTIAQKHCPFIQGMPEDVICCRINREIFLSNGVKFAPDNIAAKFAVEDDQALEYKGQSHQDYRTLKTFGFHHRYSDALNLLNNIKI